MISLFKDPPAGTTTPPGPAERLAVVYNGYEMNDPAGTAENRIQLVDTAVVPITDQVIENKQGKDGMEIYQAFKGGLSIRLRGYIKKPTLAALYDEAVLMSEKFDAALLSRRFASSTLGFQALDFYVPTADTANYPSGLVSSFYLARTMEAITFGRTKHDGFAMPFRIDMLARDPSRFFRTVQSVSPGGAPGTAADNTLGRYPSWPTLTLVMNGAGNAAFTITNSGAYGGAKTLTLNLSGRSAGQTVVVDFERKTIHVNGVLTQSLYVSGDYWQIEPRASQLIYVNDLTGVSSRTVTWYRAFPT